MNSRDPYRGSIRIRSRKRVPDARPWPVSGRCRLHRQPADRTWSAGGVAMRGGLGDESSIAAVGREEPSERLRSSLLSDLSLADVLLGAADGNQSPSESPSASVLPAGLWGFRLLGRVRTGLAAGGAPVRIPETAVFGLDDDDPLEGMWLTTGKDGKVEKHDVDEHDIIVTLGIEMDHDHANDPDGLVAVVRTPRRDGTEVRLVTAGGLKEVLNQRGGGAFAVQRLIRPAQHRSAFKNRTRWRKSAHAEAWIVTNGQPVTDTHSGVPGGFLTDATGEDLFHKCPCTIVHAAGHRGAVAETAAMCGALAEYIEATTRPLVRVHELVADFTRDHDGLWYLLQIKAIIAAPVGSSAHSGSPNSLLPRAPTAGTSSSHMEGDVPPPVERPTATHTICCRCCGRRHPAAALSQTLTLRMIRSMRTLQRARGITLSWHWHFAEPPKDLNTSGQSTDKMADQYDEMRVCSVCYDLYKAEKKLEHAARKFSKRVGVRPDDTEGEADEEWLAEAARLADVEIQAAGERGEAAGIEEAAKHAPLEPDEREALQGWRLLVVLHELRGQTDTLNALALHKPGRTLEFSCMGVQVKIPLDGALSVGRKNSMPPATSSPSFKLSPSSNSFCNQTASSIGRERIGRTSSGTVVMPSTDPGRSSVIMRWHRVFPFFCRRDDPASGGMSTVHDSIVMDKMEADTPGGPAVPGASSGEKSVSALGTSSGMINLRAAVHELAAVVLTLRSSKQRKNVIARGELPLGHLGVERPPELREQFVSLRISSEFTGKDGLLPAGAKRGSGLVLRLAVGLMKTERVGLEMVPLRPLAQSNSQRHPDEEEDVDGADCETRGPESSSVAVELEKLSSFWNDLYDIDEATAIDRFRVDNAELSETGMLSASSGRTSLPAPSSSVLASVTEQEFVLWWRRKMMGKERDRRYGAIYVPPPWHCSVDPLPGVWMRAIRSGIPSAGIEGASLESPVDGAVRGKVRPTGSRRHRRGRRHRKKNGSAATNRATGKSRKSLAALQPGEDDDTRRAQSSKQSVGIIGTNPAMPKTEVATTFQSTAAESDSEEGDTHSSTDEDDAVEIDSPAISLSSQVDLVEVDEDVNDLQTPQASGDPDCTCEGKTSAKLTDDEVDDVKGDVRAGNAATHSLTSTPQQRSRGKRKGKRTAVRQPVHLPRGSTGYNHLAKSSGAPAGTLLYWRVSLAVHGLPGKAGDSYGPDASDGLILVAELLGERLVLKIDDHNKTAQQQQETESQTGADARTGSVVVYGSILELERLLSTPRRGALRGASAACGELRLTLCARMRANSTEVASYTDDTSDALHGAAEDEVGENLLHGPWRASTIGDDSSSISSIGSTERLRASENGTDTHMRKGKVFVVGGGSVDLSTLISGGGELLRSVIIRGGTDSGRLQVGVWCDPVHAPAPNMRPARPIAVSLQN